MDDNQDRAVTWACEADRKRDLRRRKIAKMKSDIGMWWHGVYWKALHLTRLAKPYSITLCRLNLYRQFPGGRCMWCGETHK